MSNRNILFTVIFAFISFGAFTQIDSAFADAHSCNSLFYLIGGISCVGAIAMVIFGRTTPQ